MGGDESALQGEIHVDRAEVGGTEQPENKKEDRVDLHLAEDQDPDKRCIVVMLRAHRGGGRGRQRRGQKDADLHRQD